MLEPNGITSVDADETLRIRKHDIFLWTTKQTPIIQGLRAQVSSFNLNQSEYSGSIRRASTTMQEKIKSKSTLVLNCNSLLNDLAKATDQFSIQTLCERIDEYMVDILQIDSWLVEQTNLLVQLNSFNAINDQLNTIADYQRNAARDIGLTHYLWSWLTTSE